MKTTYILAALLSVASALPLPPMPTSTPTPWDTLTAHSPEDAKYPPRALPPPSAPWDTLTAPSPQDAELHHDPPLSPRALPSPPLSILPQPMPRPSTIPPPDVIPTELLGPGPVLDAPGMPPAPCALPSHTYPAVKVANDRHLPPHLLPHRPLPSVAPAAAASPAPGKGKAGVDDGVAGNGE